MRHGMVLKGLRIGMLLQLAVGPVCIFIFHTAAASGFGSAMAGMLGVTLADAAYMAAAITGISALIRRDGVSRVLKWFGAAMLCVFGVVTVLAQFGVNLLPGFHFSNDTGGAFASAFLLTASNPLTILFWAGVFSSRAAGLGAEKNDIWLFGLGALSSTVVFLTGISLAGSLLGMYLPAVAVKALNLAVGAALIFFGVRMAVLKS